MRSDGAKGLPCRVIAAWNDPGLVRWVSSLVVVVRYGILLMGFGRFCTPRLWYGMFADVFWGCRTAWEWYGRLETGFWVFRTVPRAVGFWVGVGIPGFLHHGGECGTVRNLSGGVWMVPYHAVAVRNMLGGVRGILYHAVVAVVSRMGGWPGSCG